MFASVNARAEWSRLNRPQIGHRQDTEIPLPKQSKSLSFRRVQNLTAILQLSLLRRDNKRALRAFSLVLRCEKHGVTLTKLWELGVEVLMKSTTGTSKARAEEFLGRVRLTSADVGRHSTTEQKVGHVFKWLFLT
jgi:hypothetical protein